MLNLVSPVTTVCTLFSPFVFQLGALYKATFPDFLKVTVLSFRWVTIFKSTMYGGGEKDDVAHHFQLKECKL